MNSLKAEARLHLETEESTKEKERQSPHLRELTVWGGRVTTNREGYSEDSATAGSGDPE